MKRKSTPAFWLAGSLLMGSSGLSSRLMADAQTLAWQFPTNRTVLQIDRPYPLAATASSGLPVTFRVVGGPASIQGGSLIVTNVGTVHLQASQPGTATHDPVSETRVINQVAVSLSLEADRPTAPRSSRTLHVHQDRVYVAQGSDGLEILDADPQSGLTRLGVFNTAGLTQDVQVDAGQAYLADGPAGVAILDVTNPGNPIGFNSVPSNSFTKRICLTEEHLLTAEHQLREGTAGMRIEPRNSGNGRGYFQTIGTCYDIRTSANLAFLAEGSGLQIVDISNPAAPVALGRYRTPGDQTMSLQVQGNLVYLAGETLTIVDVSNPSDPHLVGTFPERSTRLDLSGSLAMVATYQGLQVVDVSAPASPVSVGSKAIDGGASDVQVVGDLVYLAAAKAGVQVYRARQSTPQEMTFTPPQHATPADSPIRLSAAVSSGLPVTYRVLSGPASLTGDDLVLNGEGTVEILAEQAGAGVITPVSVARSIVEGGNGVRSVRLTFERGASPRSCKSRAPPLRHELHGPLLIQGSNRRLEIGSSSRRDARSEPVNSQLLWARRRFVKWTDLTPLPTPLSLTVIQSPSGGPAPGFPNSHCPAVLSSSAPLREIFTAWSASAGRHGCRHSVEAAAGAVLGW